MIRFKRLNESFPARVEKEMVDGIVKILLQVRDLDNRREIADQQLRQFKREGIQQDPESFLDRLGL